MEEWEVGDEAKNPRNDYPELIEPKKKKEFLSPLFVSKTGFKNQYLQLCQKRTLFKLSY